MKASAIKPLSQEMEEKILLTATQAFVLKGKAGTSMQDIANEAGINRTLLNYYFRSKENLFELVFQSIFKRFLPIISDTLTSDIPIITRLEKFIDYYFNILIENPIIPIFILQELTSNPQRLINALKAGGINVNPFLDALKKEMDEGIIRKMDPREIMVNLMSLIIFPFAARKIFESIIFSGNAEEYDSFIVKRKENLKIVFKEFLKP